MSTLTGNFVGRFEGLDVGEKQYWLVGGGVGVMGCLEGFLVRSEVSSRPSLITTATKSPCSYSASSSHPSGHPPSIASNVSKWGAIVGSIVPEQYPTSVHACFHAPGAVDERGKQNLLACSLREDRESRTNSLETYLQHLPLVDNQLIHNAHCMDRCCTYIPIH